MIKKKSFLEDIRKALYASNIIFYTQGFMLLRLAATEIVWSLKYDGIALMLVGWGAVSSEVYS